jgi:hypothetical protein
MKKVILLVLVVSTIASCDIRKNDKNGHPSTISHFTDTTSVQMIDSVYNFGKITEGENVVFSFRFKNSGKKPLVISAATAGCGCTIPEKPEEPLLPGETGVIKVAFHSRGMAGLIQKEVNVVSNAVPGFPNLQLVGEVVSTNN